MISETYELWCKKAVNDPDLIKELNDIKENDELISDAFYRSLEFGTAGLRGVIGAGTNRMNVYTVAQASQGLAAYVNSVTKSGKIAIAYDCRIKSDLFAKTAASVFAANGIKVYIYKELMPTPMLSFAVRHLKCDAGVVVTASHNPAKYNGYKAYAPDGSQLGPVEAGYVMDIMQGIDVFSDIKYADYDSAVKSGDIEYIGDDVIEEYLKNILEQRIEPDADLSGLKVVYTPLNGAGNKPVREILKRIGVSKVDVVKIQENPDGNFPTLPNPNPEFREAFKYALELAEKTAPDIILATDPDSDRVGAAIDIGNDYRLLTGNEIGVLLLNYILERRSQKGTLPKNPVAVKSIVSTELCQKIADFYGCKLINVLTGFKFIGEQITILENKGEAERYVFGFEESFGYLTGNYARDKDAVVASMLICEMVAFYKKKGLTLADVIEDIYRRFGYYYNLQKGFFCEGKAGMEKIATIMSDLRKLKTYEFSGLKVTEISDFKSSETVNIKTGEKTEITLPKSNVLKYCFEDGSILIIRPSGTEPKIKLYINAVGDSPDSANDKVQLLLKIGTDLLGL